MKEREFADFVIRAGLRGFYYDHGGIRTVVLDIGSCRRAVNICNHEVVAIKSTNMALDEYEEVILDNYLLDKEEEGFSLKIF